MSDIVGLLCDAQFRIPTLERNMPFGRADKTCNHAKQGALAGAVRPGQHQRATGGNGEANSTKYLATASDAGQPIASQLHCHDFAHLGVSCPRRDLPPPVREGKGIWRGASSSSPRTCGKGRGAFPRALWKGPLIRNLREERANFDLSPRAGRPGGGSQMSWPCARAEGTAFARFFPTKPCSKLSFIWQNREKVRINWRLDA